MFSLFSNCYRPLRCSSGSPEIRYATQAAPPAGEAGDLLLEHTLASKFPLELFSDVAPFSLYHFDVASLNATSKEGRNVVRKELKARKRRSITDAIRVLKELGANVTTPNNNGATPVYIPAQNGHADAIRALELMGPQMYSL